MALKNLNGNGKVVQIVLTTLLVGITVLATLLASSASGDKKYVLRSEHETLVKQIESLDQRNEADHKDIQRSLQEVLLLLGECQGHFSKRVE